MFASTGSASRMTLDKRIRPSRNPRYSIGARTYIRLTGYLVLFHAVRLKATTVSRRFLK